MQEALPTFVLNSETLPREPMNDTLATPANPSPQAEPEGPGMSDERLMLAFTQGSSEAFTELFHRYKQPVTASFVGALQGRARPRKRSSHCFAPDITMSLVPSFAPIFAPLASRFFAPTAAGPPFAPPSLVIATLFGIFLNGMRPNLAFGFAAGVSWSWSCFSRSSSPAWCSGSCSRGFRPGASRGATAAPNRGALSPELEHSVEMWKSAAGNRPRTPGRPGSSGRVRMPVTAVTRPGPARSQRL